jgi:hypothetical protein
MNMKFCLSVPKLITLITAPLVAQGELQTEGSMRNILENRPRAGHILLFELTDIPFELTAIFYLNHLGMLPKPFNVF